MKRILTVEVESEDVHVLNEITDAIHEHARRIATLTDVWAHDVAVTVSDKLA